jgi:hypothetical protein
LESALKNIALLRQAERPGQQSEADASLLVKVKSTLERARHSVNPSSRLVQGSIGYRCREEHGKWGTNSEFVFLK